MPCTKPIRGVRYADGTIRLKKGVPDHRIFGGGQKPELELPCGRCMDCKIRRSQDWTTRATHESQLHEKTSFLTLTFSDDGLGLRELQRDTHPFDLDVRDWQLFAKRLRKELHKRRMGTLRYFQVGEYGEQELRPHYHALIFGQDFREGLTAQWKDDQGHPVWTSEIVEKCWPYGFHEIKEMVPETISYVCKYVQKKLYGHQKTKALERVDSHSGECVTVRPELASMSRGRGENKGIGHGWWRKWGQEVFPDDFVILKGKKTPVPKYYFKQLEQENPELAEAVTKLRQKSTAGRLDDNTPERRLVREKVTKAKTGLAAKRKL